MAPDYARKCLKKGVRPPAEQERPRKGRLTDRVTQGALRSI